MCRQIGILRWIIRPSTGGKGMTTRRAGVLFLEPGVFRLGGSQRRGSQWQPTRAVTDRKSRTWNLEQSLQQPRSSAEDVSAARNSVSDSLYHSQAGRWRCFGPAKASCQSRVHCSCHLFFELEDEAISGFLCTTTKHTTLTTDPPAVPLPLQQNCPLGRRRPGRRMARDPPPIGPLLATPWSSTGPCRCLRSLSNR